MKFVIALVCFCLFIQSYYPASATTTQPKLDCTPLISRNLTVGDKDTLKSSDVTKLQKFLILFGRSEEELDQFKSFGTYDSKTANLVTSFQIYVNVAISEDPREAKKLKLKKINTSQFGSVGKETRHALNKLCGLQKNSLNSPLVSGKDVGVKSKINSIRALAEIYYDSNKNSYGVSATCKQGFFKDSHIAVDVRGATCRSKSDAYVVYVPLNKSAWCVDSTGFAGEITTKPKKDAYTCK